MRRFLISILAIIVFSIAGISIYIGTIGRIPNQVITFETSGGNKIDNLISKKDTVVDLPIPEREGYEFDGWYEAGVKVANSYVLTKDTTLVAKWNIKTYKVTFNPLNDTEILSINIIEGSKIDFPTEPTMEHYKFLYWTLENGEKVSDDYKVTSNTNLFAKWEEIN